MKIWSNRYSVRLQWLALINEICPLDDEQAWRIFGYQSLEEYQQELMLSRWYRDRL